MNRPPHAPLRSALLGALVSAGLVLSMGASGHLGQQSQLPPAAHACTLITPEQAAILRHMSLVTIDDGFGNPLETIRFTGVNVQIVNGLGSTNGYPTDPSETSPGLTQVNGLGNLIVGYNRVDFPTPSPHNGSHNLVLGDNNDYSSFAGIVAGQTNELNSPYSAVLGGSRNRVPAGTVYATISGGSYNTATGAFSSIVGGRENQASGDHATIGAGYANLAAGEYSSVQGGSGNDASAIYCSISGGGNNEASASGAWVGGGGGNHASGSLSAVSGGYLNTGAGFWSSVCGGQFHTAPGQLDWVAGTLFEDE